jgi:hypothetical protein
VSRRSKSPAAPTWVWVIALLLVSVVASLVRDWLPWSDPSDGGIAITAEDGEEEEVLELFESRRSGEMVVVAGIVDGVLSDDNDGSRHQRFIVRTGSGHTLLVAHNIDLAPRVPLRAGDQVRLRGEYEWNDQGGVLHWTHDDRAGDHPGGWIEFQGDRYR